CTSLKIEHSGTRARAVRFVVWQLAGILGASILATQHVLQITDSHLLVRRLASAVLQRRLIRPQRHVAIPALRRIVTVRFREGLRSRLAAARERVARLRGGTASIPPGLPSINLDGLHMPRLVRHVAMQPPLRSLGASLRQHLRPLHSPVDATRIGRYQIDSGRAAMPINIVLVLMEAFALRGETSLVRLCAARAATAANTDRAALRGKPGDEALNILGMVLVGQQPATQPGQGDTLGAVLERNFNLSHTFTAAPVTRTFRSGDL